MKYTSKVDSNSTYGRLARGAIFTRADGTGLYFKSFNGDAKIIFSEASQTAIAGDDTYFSDDAVVCIVKELKATL